MSEKKQDVIECQAPTAICSYNLRHFEATGYWVCNMHNRITNHQVSEKSHKPCIDVDPNPCKPCAKVMGIDTHRAFGKQEW